MSSFYALFTAQNQLKEEKMADIHESLILNPHWIFDPAIWRILDQGDKAKIAAVAKIQLELIHSQAMANVKAIEALQGVVAGSAQR